MAKKKFEMPKTLWVMAYNTFTPLGSVSHVSFDEQLYLSKEECQQAIDEMPGWIGMGDRKQYRPMPLTAPVISE